MSRAVKSGVLDIDEKQIKSGVDALYQYVHKKAGKDGELFDEVSKINVQISFKKVPDVKDQVIKVRLPHSLVRHNTDVCLFVKDLNKNARDYTPSVQHFQDLLSSNGVKNITEVIPLKRVKTEFQPYEARRSLSDMYDVYLADASIIWRLPPLLGKYFYGRKRFPVQVDMTAKDLKREIDRALHVTQCIVGGRGSSCMVTVANTGLTRAATTENILTAVRAVAAAIPGGPINVRNLHLKTLDSPAIPVYLSSGTANDVVLPEKKRKIEEVYEDEVSTVMEGKVRITADGEITIIRTHSEGEEEEEEDDNDDDDMSDSSEAEDADSLGAMEMAVIRKHAKKSQMSEDSAEGAVKSKEGPPLKRKKAVKDVVSSKTTKPAQTEESSHSSVTKVVREKSLKKKLTKTVTKKGNAKKSKPVDNEGSDDGPVAKPVAKKLIKKKKATKVSSKVQKPAKVGKKSMRQSFPKALPRKKILKGGLKQPR